MSRAGTIEHLARAVVRCGSVVPESPDAVARLAALSAALDSPVDPDEAEVEAVRAERDRQRAKGFSDEQDFPDTVSAPALLDAEEREHRARCDVAMAAGAVTWEHILREEVAEALAAKTDEERRVELLQVAAVCVRWARSIARNR